MTNETQNIKFYEAANANDLNLLKELFLQYTHEHMSKKNPLFGLYLTKDNHGVDLLVPFNTTEIAAKNGNLEMLAWASKNGCHCTEYTCNYVIKNGHLFILKYLLENKCEYSKFICSTAAEYGQLDILKYLHENNFYWDVWVPYYAAKNGHVDCLKYAHVNGCPWDEGTCEIALQYCQYECLKYAYENGCLLTERVPAIHSYYMTEYLSSYRLTNEEFELRLKKKDDFLKCFNYCYQNWKDPIDFWVFSTDLPMQTFDYDEEEGVTIRIMTAFFSDIIDLYPSGIENPLWDLLISQDINLRNIPALQPTSYDDPHDIMLKTERQQSLDKFQDMIDLKKKIISGKVIFSQQEYFENKYKEYDTRYQNHKLWLNYDRFQGIDKAAFYGDLEAIKYLHSQNYFWCYRTTYIAAERGHLESLQYLYENRCKIDVNAPKCAAKNGKINTFKYCFQIWKSPQEFWNCKFDLSLIIDQIDLDDHIWRQLLNLDLTRYPELESKVENKKIEIQEMKNKLLNLSSIPKDIIKYYVYEYI